MATDTGLEAEYETDLEDDVPPEPTIEERARAMGWHPLEEFRGDPKRWTSAEDFIARGERELPIMRDQNRRMSERLARQEAQLAELAPLRETVTSMEKALRDMRDLARRSSERGYKQALNDLKTQRREAVEAGDTVGFEAAEAKIEALETERAEVVAPPEPAPAEAAPAPTPVVDPAITAFVQDNATWWQKDTVLTQAMIAAHTLIGRRYPKMALADQLLEAKRRVIADYPESFEGDPDADQELEQEQEDPPMRPARPAPRAPGVQRPSAPSSTPRRGADIWATAIPDAREREQAKAAYQNQKRHMPDMSQEEYLALYENPHADVLEIRRAARSNRK